MRLATVRTPTGTRAVRVVGDELVLLDAPDVGALLAAGPLAAHADPGLGAAVLAWGDADLAPVVPRPGKIVCLGLNYASHIREMGHPRPEHPTLFAKFADALVGPRDPITLPRVATKPDYEAELAFVIGTTVRHADAAAARAAIAGFTISNDVTMRDWQGRTSQWLQGKTFEGTTPLGPVLVTPEELDDGRDLGIECRVGGELRQKARTADMVFDPVAIVRYVSTVVTLRPGDVISTGTTAGVGHALDPPVYLSAGDVVAVTIEGIGELVNLCVAEPATPGP